MQLGIAKIFNIKWPLDEQSAKSCLLVNLAIWPGLGSTLARRKVGWIQMAMALSGVFAVAIGLQMFMAMIWQETREPTWHDRFVWVAITGFGLFISSWVWGTITGFSIRAEVKAASTQRPSQPPKLPSTTPPPLPPKS